MTCPSPEYCALNGCSNNGCARAPYRVAPPPVSHLLFGFACLMAWPLGIGAVLVALWVMT
jgi:hypothetical protein